MKELGPFNSLRNFISYVAAGRLHFPRQRVGEEIYLDGEKWVIFRHIVVDPTANQPQKPGAVFCPRFHIAGMSVRQNMFFSWLPIPFFVGLPGFRSKLWLYDPQSGDFSGYYEWDTTSDAENYRQSFAARFMTRRSIPNSVSFKVIPQE